MTNNLLIMPLLIPLIAAVLQIFGMRHVPIQRWLGGIAVIVNVGVAVWIVITVRVEGIQTLAMGGWAAPYGIVFVADMFAALLVLTTSILGAVCLFYAFASIGEEREKHHFYPFFQFLLVGVYGSFLTGDLFNLFVCFEVMLVSSYALIVLGGTKRQLQVTLKYILINIVSSSLFVASMAYLYAAVGTLNMAHLSQRVAEAGQDGIIGVIAFLFLIVFGLKAGLFLFFWLPGSYAAPPSVITAIFAGLLTKVGLYAIIRTFTLIFYHDTGFLYTLIGWMGIASMVLGVIGAVAYRDVNKILVYNVVAGVGLIAFGLATANVAGIEGAVFYMLHDMIVKALLFLLAGIMIGALGTTNLKDMSGLIKRYPFTGWMFFITGLALAGVPPLSGFIGKLLIVQGGMERGWYTMTIISLIASLLMLYSVMRIFMLAFWGKDRPLIDDRAVFQDSPEVKREVYHEWSPFRPRRLMAASSVLFAFVILIGLGAGWIQTFVAQAADVLVHPTLYIQAVLKE
ncbi:Na+/H+-antiporter, MnhD subunit [Paenibacillus nuruki]|uniref:Na+/H+-antiporter, MnhD subunit n=2 Tax=Paenibacillus TaxID=44249 RepID=A0A1E3L607_9BACL|nr:Na+/H+-antiporter, MnhD subunit [Paenibacillus nuruki]TKJ93410.1 Na+/H+ antiporter subunit D [Paenibacillus sp. CFBP13512]